MTAVLCDDAQAQKRSFSGQQGTWHLPSILEDGWAKRMHEVDTQE